MRSSRRGTGYAVIGFILISGVVAGGMTWATVLTWRLAKLDVEDERAGRRREALLRMDTYLGQIVASEAAREYDDYVAIRTPDAIWSKELKDLVPGDYLQPSPIALYGPRHDWIELYFQVDQHGQWSSPHLPEEAAPWATDAFVWDIASIRQARRTLDGLIDTFPLAELQAQVAQAIEHVRRSNGGMNTAEQPKQIRLAQHSSDPQPRRRPPVSREYELRSRRQQGLQRRHVPKPKCVPEDIAEGNLQNRAAVQPATPEDACFQVSSVEISLSPLVPLWLVPGPEEARKIAFVRTVRVDNQLLLHQGFVANWDRLKQELLEQTEDLFPNADLEPVEMESAPDLEASRLELSQVPARLSVAGGQPLAGTLAWQSVGGVLLTSWAAALAVLVAAGWGVWNLIALTERRLQFAYAVTHELRTPLTTFRLYSDLLAAGLVPEASKQEYLDTLNRESERLANLVEDVLEYARLDTQKIRLNPVRLEGASLLTTLVEGLEARCKANGITAHTKNDIPKDRSVRTDVDLVRQIAGVLVNNACRHVRESDHPAVLLHLASENGVLHVNVVDSGPGIDRGDARRIFRPFRRGKKAEATAQGGVGLGLALARNWASLLGGRLDLVARHHSEYGGAHFRLSLPAEMPTRT